MRAQLDDSDDRMPKKIRVAQSEKIPYMMIAGGEDVEAGAVSFRFRDGTQRNSIPIDQAIEEIVASIKGRVQV